MKLQANGTLGTILLVCVTLTLAGCWEDSDDRLSEVDIAPPLVLPPQGNTNIPDPTLTIFDNAPVSVGGEMTLVWSDEFEGSAINSENWFFQSGDGTDEGIPGWGNNELQYYLPDSAEISDGMLRITARKEQVGPFNYTSARIITRDRVAVRYGRIEARMRLPAGQGLWPAFWMMPQDSVYGTWAASGELDIMEAINPGASGGNHIYGTIHYGGPFPNNVFSGERYLVATDVTAEFHTYAVEWDPTEIRWYVDDTLYAVRNSWSSTGGEFPAPFDEPFYIIFNVAVGGNFPGAPAANTVFPVSMEVDWVRVYSGEP